MSINRETQSLDRSVGQLWEWLAGREFVRPLSGFETLSADCSWTHDKSLRGATRHFGRHVPSGPAIFKLIFWGKPHAY